MENLNVDPSYPIVFSKILHGIESSILNSGYIMEILLALLIVIAILLVLLVSKFTQHKNFVADHDTKISAVKEEHSKNLITQSQNLKSEHCDLMRQSLAELSQTFDVERTNNLELLKKWQTTAEVQNTTINELKLQCKSIKDAYDAVVLKCEYWEAKYLELKQKLSLILTDSSSETVSSGGESVGIAVAFSNGSSTIVNSEDSTDWNKLLDTQV